MREIVRPSGAVAELLAAEFEAKEFNVSGQMLPVPELLPTPPVLQTWRPDPPDWQLEAQEAAERQQAERERIEREAAAALREQRLAAEIAAIDEPETLPHRRGWMRRQA